MFVVPPSCDVADGDADADISRQNMLYTWISDLLFVTPLI